MAKELQMFLVNVNGDVSETRTVHVQDKLENYYELLGCECIEIVTRKIGDKYYSIICDEEGKLKQNLTSGIMKDHSDCFVGNILICGLGDNKGDLTEITDEDCTEIAKHIFLVFENNKEHNCLFGIEY